MTDLVPADGMSLNPDAVRPPFVWQVSLPDDATWSVLDTNPSSWQRSVDRLVDDRLAGTRVQAAEKREIVRFVSDLVAQCQQAGTLLSLVQIGRLAEGGITTAGLHLAWYDSTPDPADLSTVRRALSRQGVIEEHDTPAGPVLLQRDHLSVDPFGTGRIGLSSLQAYLPVSTRSWTLVAATATPHPTMVEPLRDLVLHVVGSFRVTDGAAPTPVARTEAFLAPQSERYRPVERPAAPGIQRGFGTLRPHTVDGEADLTRPLDRPAGENGGAS